MKTKSFIRNYRLGVRVWDEGNKAKLRSGFLQCLKLQEYINTKPKTFTIEPWESANAISWEKVKETTYHGVDWHGYVEHSDSTEMSACTGMIDFSYKTKTENCDNITIIFDENTNGNFTHEFIDATNLSKA